MTMLNTRSGKHLSSYFSVLPNLLSFAKANVINVTNGALMEQENKYMRIGLTNRVAWVLVVFWCLLGENQGSVYVKFIHSMQTWWNLGTSTCSVVWQILGMSLYQNCNTWAELNLGHELLITSRFLWDVIIHIYTNLNRRWMGIHIAPTSAKKRRNHSIFVFVSTPFKMCSIILLKLMLTKISKWLWKHNFHYKYEMNKYNFKYICCGVPI